MNLYEIISTLNVINRARNHSKTTLYPCVGTLRQEQTMTSEQQMAAKLLALSSYLFEENHGVLFHLVLLEKLRRRCHCKLFVSQIKSSFLKRLCCLTFQTLQNGARVIQHSYLKSCEKESTPSEVSKF